VRVGIELGPQEYLSSALSTYPRLTQYNWYLINRELFFSWFKYTVCIVYKIYCLSISLLFTECSGRAPPPPQEVYHTYISNYLCMNLKEVQWLNFSTELKFAFNIFNYCTSRRILNWFSFKELWSFHFSIIPFVCFCAGNFFKFFLKI